MIKLSSLLIVIPCWLLLNVGAQGLMRLMPLTAKSYDMIEPFNATDNIRGGSQYLKHLMNTYNNNITLALAVYNAGETAVTKYQRGSALPRNAALR